LTSKEEDSREALKRGRRKDRVMGRVKHVTDDTVSKTDSRAIAVLLLGLDSVDDET
jgi:hypothetical protein